MLDWFAVEDGFVIEKWMTDWEVWLRCQLFGAPALITALENFIKIKVDKHPDSCDTHRVRKRSKSGR